MKKATYKLNYYDQDGKRRGKTFSAPTKRQAKALAQEWLDLHTEGGKEIGTVAEAVREYIEAKTPVLSPSTVRAYESIERNRLDPIGAVRLPRLTSAELQRWIGSMASDGLTPKTIANCMRLVKSAAVFAGVAWSFDVRLPQRVRYTAACPSDADIAALIAQLRRDGAGVVLRAVLLAAFGPCRRSEVCAMTDADIHGNRIHVCKALVLDPGGEWVVKGTKTTDSERWIDYPAFVIEQCKGIRGRLVDITPNQVSDRFNVAVAAAGLQHFRFHDLRHYGASIMAYIGGISQRTIEDRGGWSPNSTTLRTVYQNAIANKAQAENKRINAYFERFRKAL